MSGTQRLVFVCIAIAIANLMLSQAPTVAQTLTTTSILSQARAALGGDAMDRIYSLHLRGRLTVGGIKGTFDEWLDTRHSTSAEFDDLGPLSGGQGYNGVNAWNQDVTGLTWIDGGQGGRLSAIATSYLANNDFVRPGLRGKVEYLGRGRKKSVEFDILSAVPPNGLPLKIWLDARTHLPARTTTQIGVQSTTTSLQDYRLVGGIRIPFHSHSISDSGNETDAMVTTAQPNVSDIQDHIAIPTTQPHDYKLSGGTATTVPIRIIDNHVYISVRLNGHGPFLFAFDTGGSNVLDIGAAKAMGLSLNGSLQNGGVGAATEGFSFAKLARLDIGNATLTNQVFAIVPVRQGFGVSMGVPVDGLIGFEVLARFNTSFDYGNERVTFSIPSRATTPSPGADIIPFVFNGTIPQVRCKLDEIPGNCSVDTGSRASVSILTPFLAAHPSVIPAKVTAPGANGFGIGGAAIGRLGRLRSLTIGTTTLKDVIADLSAQKKGYYATPFIAANIGGGVWKRFTVSFNYHRQIMTLTPNAAFSRRDSYDRSGLFIIAPHGKPTILNVRPGTPAAAAGLVNGEPIVAVNGRSAIGLTLHDIRQLLRAPAGTLVQLTVKDKVGPARTVRFILRDYV